MRPRDDALVRRSSENFDQDAKDEYSMSGLLFLLVIIGVVGVALAAGWPGNDALREIGGALISGALIAGVILLYEQRAESRRVRLDDAREDRYELKAEKRDERSGIRAEMFDERSHGRSIDLLAREDRLAALRRVDDFIADELAPLTIKLPRLPAEARDLSPHEKGVVDPWLRRVAEAVNFSLRTLVERTGSQELYDQYYALSHHVSKIPSVKSPQQANVFSQGLLSETMIFERVAGELRRSERDPDRTEPGIDTFLSVDRLAERHAGDDRSGIPDDGPKSASVCLRAGPQQV